MLGLVVGSAMGIAQRKRTLLLFVFPFAVSECYVAIAGSFRGQLRGNASLLPPFILVQLALIGYFVYKEQASLRRDLCVYDLFSELRPVCLICWRNGFR